MSTRILKTENYEKCRLRHCFCKVEKTVNHLEYQLHWGNLLHCYRGEEQVQSVVKLIWEKVWCQVRVRNRVHRGNLLQCSHQEMKNRGNQFKSSVFKHADTSKLGRSLLEGNKDHLLSQARSELMKQEHEVGSLNNCIRELQQHALCSKIGITGRSSRIYCISKRTITPTRRSIHEGKSASRYSNRNYARNGRNEESSRTTSWRILCTKIERKSWDNTRLASHMQEMQEQMNSMSGPGDFQEVEQNYSGRLSHVSCQPAMIPSSRSMLSRDKRWPLDTWNRSGLQENVFW